MARAVFLDRDGVINQKAPEGEYITRWEDFHILPGVVEAIALLNRADFRVIVVTNQRCIAKGLISPVELQRLHQRMTDRLSRAGAKLEAVYYCPHELEPVCRCRKPAAGMLLDAARDHDIELAESWMIGDSDIDIKTGKNAGCKTARLFTGNTIENERRNGRTVSSSADIVALSLRDAVHEMLRTVTAPASFSASRAAHR